jgi:hypothetical protein
MVYAQLCQPMVLGFARLTATCYSVPQEGRRKILNSHLSHMRMALSPEWHLGREFCHLHPLPASVPGSRGETNPGDSKALWSQFLPQEKASSEGGLFPSGNSDFVFLEALKGLPSPGTFQRVS